MDEGIKPKHSNSCISLLDAHDYEILCWIYGRMNLLHILTCGCPQTNRMDILSEVKLENIHFPGVLIFR